MLKEHDKEVGHRVWFRRLSCDEIGQILKIPGHRGSAGAVAWSSDVGGVQIGRVQWPLLQETGVCVWHAEWNSVGGFNPDVVLVQILPPRLLNCFTDLLWNTLPNCHQFP